MVVVKDSAPGVKKINDPILDASEAFVLFRLVCKWLLTDPFKESIEKSDFESRTHIPNRFSTKRWSQLGEGVAS
jgi:hypothetical protein